MAERKKARGTGVMRALLALVLIAAILAVLGGQYGRWDPLYDLLNAGLLPIALFLTAIAAIALKLRGRLMAAIAAAGSVAALMQIGSDVAPPAFNRDGRQIIRVASINAHHSNIDPELLGRQLAATDADIVLVQESNGTAAQQIAKALPEFYHVHSCPYEYCSMTILSRWPAENIALPARKGPVSALLAARIQTPAGQVQAINVHLPRPSQEYAFESRQAALAAIDLLGPEGLIVAGDFNLPSGSFALRQFSGEGGLWRHDFYWPTYPAYGRFGPMIDIDHIFTSRDLKSHGCERLAQNGSDHRAMACVMSIDPSDYDRDPKPMPRAIP